MCRHKTGSIYNTYGSARASICREKKRKKKKKKKKGSARAVSLKILLVREYTESLYLTLEM